MKEVNLNPLAKLNLSAKTFNENIDTDENTGADFLFDDETAETEGTDGFVRTQSTAAPKQPAATRRIALQKEQAGQLPITVSPQPFVYVPQKNIFLSGLSGDSDDASVEELEAQKQAEMEALQAEILRNLYRMWFSHPAMEAVVYWNVVDGFAAFAPQGDMTAGENYYHGGLVRYDFTPKESYRVIQELFTKTWHTDLTLDTDTDELNFKGFYGVYELEIEAQGKSVRREIHLTRECGNHFYLTI